MVALKALLEWMYTVDVFFINRCAWSQNDKFTMHHESFYIRNWNEKLLVKCILHLHNTVIFHVMDRCVSDNAGIIRKKKKKKKREYVIGGNVLLWGIYLIAENSYQWTNHVLHWKQKKNVPICVSGILKWRCIWYDHQLFVIKWIEVNFILFF